MNTQNLENKKTWWSLLHLVAQGDQMYQGHRHHQQTSLDWKWTFLFHFAWSFQIWCLLLSSYWPLIQLQLSPSSSLLSISRKFPKWEEFSWSVWLSVFQPDKKNLNLKLFFQTDFFHFIIFVIFRFEDESRWKRMHVHAFVSSIGTFPKPSVLLRFQRFQEVFAYLIIGRIVDSRSWFCSLVLPHRREW